MTTGIFLQYLTHNPESVRDFDVFILDEVHERDVDMDFVFMILKGVLKSEKEKRLILMSATIQSEYMSAYFVNDNFSKLGLGFKNSAVNFFHKGSRLNKQDRSRRDREKIKFCPIIEVDTKPLYHIRTYYLDEFHKFFGFGSESFEKYSSCELTLEKAFLVKEFMDIAIELILHILDLEGGDKIKPYGRFLIFLPGLAEIFFFSNLLRSRVLPEAKDAEIVQIHSKLLDKSKVLAMQKQKTYFLLATNIAESSITIPNVRYVIDFCLAKEQRFTKKRASFLGLGWSSKSSCVQRKGRTGRCNDGNYFIMVQRSFYQRLSDNIEPEILRTPLDKLVLKMNTINEKIQNISSQRHRIQLEEMFGDIFKAFDLCIERIDRGSIEDSLSFL